MVSEYDSGEGGKGIPTVLYSLCQPPFPSIDESDLRGDGEGEEVIVCRWIFLYITRTVDGESGREGEETVCLSGHGLPASG